MARNYLDEIREREEEQTRLELESLSFWERHRDTLLTIGALLYVGVSLRDPIKRGLKARQTLRCLASG